MFDGAAFGAEMVDVVKAYVDKVTAPLLVRIADLEQQLSDRPTAGALKGLAQEEVRQALTFELCSSADTDLARMVGDEVGKAVAALPPARDGVDVDMGAVERLVAAEVAKLPAPKDGVSLSPDDLAPMVTAEVQKAVAALPEPKDGVGVAGALIDRDGSLVLTLTNGDAKNLGCVVGRDVELAEVHRLVAAEVAKLPPPKDGKDGFSLADFDTELMEDGRTVLLKFGQGDTTEIHELCFPLVIDRGVYRAEAQYAKGDGVTWGGSFWIAQCDTSAKPETNADWRLAVKRGRDGKDLSK